MSYYLTKSNPQVFKLREALAYFESHPEVDVCWTICKDAKRSDILFIGQPGEEAGIYAVAIVSSPPELTKIPTSEAFWLNPPGKPLYQAPIESLTAKPHPALERSLRGFPILLQIATWLRCQGSVRHLSDEEGRALLRFVKRHNSLINNVGTE